MVESQAQDGDAGERTPARRQNVDKYLGTDCDGDDGKNLTKVGYSQKNCRIYTVSAAQSTRGRSADRGAPRIEADDHAPAHPASAPAVFLSGGEALSSISSDLTGPGRALGGETFEWLLSARSACFSKAGDICGQLRSQLRSQLWSQLSDQLNDPYFEQHETDVSVCKVKQHSSGTLQLDTSDFDSQGSRTKNHESMVVRKC